MNELLIRKEIYFKFVKPILKLFLFGATFCFCKLMKLAVLIVDSYNKRVSQVSDEFF